MLVQFNKILSYLKVYNVPKPPLLRSFMAEVKLLFKSNKR